MTSRLIHAVSLILISTAAVSAIADWSTEFGPTGLTRSGHVAAVVEYDDQLVVAGEFRTAGRDSVTNIARWTGVAWLPFGNGLKFVECMTVHDGRLYAGGRFKADDDTPAEGLAFWTGQDWRPCSTSLRGEVYALASYRGELVVGGRFVIEEDEQIRHLARWTGTSWQPLGKGIALGGRTRIEALEIHGDDLVAAGVFGRAGEIEASNIARWDGQDWRRIGHGADDVVHAVLSWHSLLYAAGRFRTMDGDSASCVAVWDGSTWSSLGTGIHQEPDGEAVVNDLEIWQRNLVAAGEFRGAGGEEAWSIATWDGRRWQATPPGFFDDTGVKRPVSVLDLALHDGRLVAAGKMKGGQGYLVNSLGLWDGKRWDPLVSGQGAEGAVEEIKSIQDRTYVGSSRPVGLRNVQGVAVWEDGLWQQLAPELDGGGVFRTELETITEHQGRIVSFGRLYEDPYGDFRARHVSTCHLAEWDGQWRVFTPPSDQDAKWARRIVSLGDSILVLGMFTDPAGSDIPGVVWDGTEWSALVLPEGARGLGHTVVVAGRLYVSWERATKDEPPVFAIAEWDGERWRTIKSGLLNQVLALAEWEGRLVASFSIPHENSSVHDNIQQWDGEQWIAVPGSFSYRHAQDGRVEALAEYDGCLVAGGNFKGVDSLACRGVAFWDGEIWRPLGGGVDGEARILAPTPTGLWLGGGFWNAGGMPSRCLARWDGPLPVDSPVDLFPAYEPEPRPTTRRGDGWHSHALDLTLPAGPFANGDFAAWGDSVPEHWEYDVLAKCPAGSCILEPPPGGGVLLEVAGEERCYPALEQRFTVEGGRFYRVRARYEISGVPAGFRGSVCYMTFGDYQLDHSGYEYGPLHTGMRVGFEPGREDTAEIVLRVDAGAEVGVVSVRVTAPRARLVLHEVQVDTIALAEDDITRMLITELQENYAPQSDRHVDWSDLRRRFTGAGAADWPDHGELVTELLRSLQESRVTLSGGEADMGFTSMLFKQGPVPEEDRLTRERVSAIRNRLLDWQAQGWRSPSGWTNDGIIYCDIRQAHVVEKQLADLLGAKGILLDLRQAEFDSQHRARERLLDVAGRLTAEPVVYGYLTANDGAEDTLRILPREPVISGIPVVCLIGEGCVGMGAEFAQMMKALPGVTLVGRPTRGGTGGMARFTLPVGSHVNYPARRMWTPAGESVNDTHGVRPDVTVEPDGTLDPVFEEGLRILRMRLAER